MGSSILCIDPREIRASGIAEKVLNSIRPGLAANEKSRRARQAKRDRVLAKAFSVTTPLDHGVYPGFGPHRNAFPALAVPIPEVEIKLFGIKIIRGTTYVLEKRYIEPEYDLSIHVVDEQTAQEVFSPIMNSGKFYTRGPGFVMWRGASHEDTLNALFAVEFFGKLKIYASVLKKGNGN